MIQTRPETPDTNMSTLANLKSGLQGRIYDIEVLLEAVTTFQTAAQEFEHTEYIQRIYDIILEASAKFLDIEARHNLRCPTCMERILERHQLVLDDQRKPGENNQQSHHDTRGKHQEPNQSRRAQGFQKLLREH